MHFQGKLRIVSADRPVGHLHVWVAETGLADAPADEVFQLLLEHYALVREGDAWRVELAFDAPEFPERGVFSLYASIEANPALGLNKGDWFCRESHDFRDTPAGPFHLTLRRL